MPYHIDPEINHGIDKLHCQLRRRGDYRDFRQRTYQAFPTKVLISMDLPFPLYAAARYIATQPDMQLVQLVSFGCGVDAITTDEVRSIWRRKAR